MSISNIQLRLQDLIDTSARDGKHFLEVGDRARAAVLLAKSGGYKHALSIVNEEL